MGSPKIPEAPEPPAPPPAPAKVAEEVLTPEVSKRDSKKLRRGLSSLTIRRPSVGTSGVMGSGINFGG